MTEDEIADVTIRYVLIDADYNERGFSVGNRLVVLVERQSIFKEAYNMSQIRPITDLRNTTEISELCHARREPLLLQERLRRFSCYEH